VEGPQLNFGRGGHSYLFLLHHRRAHHVAKLRAITDIESQSLRFISILLSIQHSRVTHHSVIRGCYVYNDRTFNASDRCCHYALCNEAQSLAAEIAF
jgi:hypothetical protein